MTHLSPCPSCQRHVRADEVCPFCGADLPPATPPAPEPRHGLRRAAMLAVSAALVGGGAIDCGSTVTDQQNAAGTGTGTGGGGGQGGASTVGSTGANTGTGAGSVSSSEAASSSSSTTASSSGGTGGAPSTSSGGGIAPPYGSPPF
jgi:hypothetical protein